MTVLDPRLSDWRPPDDFQEVPSAVEGVLVFAPKPAEAVDASEAPRTFRCANCGAATGFDEKKGALACPYCGHTETPGAAEVGLAAAEQEFTLEAMAADRSGWGVARRELHCESCGTDLAVEEGTISTSCPFCASNQVNLRDAAGVAMRPRYLVPFKVDAKGVAQAAKTWLGKGWMHPGNLASVASVDRFSGVYLSYWTFSASLSSAWEAEVGYERSESYYDHASKSWKTRTVIDWRWENGAVRPDIDNLLVPGSTKLSRRLLERMHDFDLGALVEYAPEFLAGWKAQAYDIPLPEAWELGKAAMRERAKAACYADIPTSHVRNFSMTANFENERWKLVLLPIWISAYRFGGRVWRVMVNGQTGTVSGQKPVAWWKVWAAIAAMWSPTVLLGLLGLVLLVIGVGVVPLILAFVCLFPAGIFSMSVYRKAVDSEAE